MVSVLLTGHSGFVGRNFIKYFSPYCRIHCQSKNSKIIIDTHVVAHFAGLSHDTNGIFSATDYNKVNFELTKNIFSAFILSDAKVFLFISSVKAVLDSPDGPLTETHIQNPQTEFGKSKLLAEQYILSKEIPTGKRVYILRPCMIHGPGNKGNLNLLYKLVSKGIPWPLGAFDNKRSFCTIDNLCFIINELIENEKIPSGVYNVADDEALSTNEVISLLSESRNRKSKILMLPKGLIKVFAKLGNLFRLPLTTDRLQKLTESYVVSNQKIKSAIGKHLQVSAKEGLLKTFNSFHTNAK
jgi:nucleoside-diphosphate-sugar epimerase